MLQRKILVASAFVVCAGGSAGQRRGIPRGWHRDAVADIARGRPQRAIEKLEAGGPAAATDPETHFVLAWACAAAGEPEAAMQHVERALDLGLAPSRFLAGGKRWSASLAGLGAFRQRFAGASPLVHGPMLGAVEPTSVKVWVRTAQPAAVTIVVQAGKEEVARAGGRTRSTTDLTGVVQVTGLEADRVYDYRVLVEGEEVAADLPRRLRTAPTKAARFTLAFGGGADYHPENERMWRTIASKKPRLLLLLGDNVYIDRPKLAAVQRYCYARRHSRPEFRRLVAQVPVYAIWDDHDFITNDRWGGPAVDKPAWKRRVFEVFRQNFVNPSYGGGDARPGCWFEFSHGDVDFFLLDGRYYRTDPRKEPRSMLGPVQKRWLLDALARSRATFKVLCSPVAWTFHAKGESKDTWNGYREERDEIFGFLTEKRIDGVVLLSADRHRSDCWRIARPDAYDLYEFNSSRLTNVHAHRKMPAALFSYNETQSFGLVAFDTETTDPTVRYDIVDIDGRLVWGRTWKHSELSHASAPGRRR